jgi:hypothetical protein
MEWRKHMQITEWVRIEYPYINTLTTTAKGQTIPSKLGKRLG